jgi:enamine deaminase RidA (YjgF/YER057c/UK114 family)
VFTSAVIGVIEQDEGVPVLAATFEEQLRIVGDRLGRRLGHLGCSPADIIDATVCVDPSVEIKPVHRSTGYRNRCSRVTNLHSASCAANVYADVFGERQGHRVQATPTLDA